MDWNEVFESAKAWTQEAGEILRKATQEKIIVEYKTSAADLVTQKDKEIEQFFIDRIAKEYPSHFLLGEEGLASDQKFSPDREVVWIVDPIDGTTNFVHQKRNFAISIGIFEFGLPKIGIVYDPVADELFHAQVGKGAFLNNIPLPKLADKTLEEAIISINQLWLVHNNYIDHQIFSSVIQKARGTRYIGSAALEIVYIACGRLDTYIDFRLSPWDIAGGMVILNEVGGVMKTFENQPFNVFTRSSTVFSNNKVLEELFLNL
ncbi:inositol monophosphatase family protein [Cytobacillus sp. S13-E01]|uniref:inositol monophosphatase family protein n=1 Tax=Cytobacillus sp. S13-E01 TaxID=3031326 RepID=UPI0023D7F4A5|nr:inositol monophosphatase family protein [Cytobacillus sp. S13-E01]MDF0726287.1 inositol monophosphatase family protein [Cytobacillus sp. S13-E01]